MSNLDLTCLGAPCEQVQKVGTLQYNDDYGVEIVTLFDGHLSFGNTWGICYLETNFLLLTGNTSTGQGSSNSITRLIKNYMVQCENLGSLHVAQERQVFCTRFGKELTVAFRMLN